MLTNLGNLTLAKGVVKFVRALFSRSTNQEPKDPTDWIILGVWDLLSFITVDILLANAVLVLVVCLVVSNNSHGNYSSSKFFSFNINTVPVLIFAADFNLFNYVFVSLTLAY